MKPKGAVAAGHALTASAAAEVLEAGGTAVDGAIAAGFMACVAEPVLASLGGGGFAMVSATGGVPELFDFFAQAPLAHNRDGTGFNEIVADFGVTSQRFCIGPASAATPGLVPGLLTLHEAFATMPLSELVGPATRAARQGVDVTPFQAYLGAVVGPILSASAEARALFAPGGRPHPAGAIVRNPDLAGFLSDLGAKGMAAYAQGVVPSIIAGQERGHLRQADFDRYRVERRPALSFRYGAARIFTNPSPAAGGILVAHTLSGLSGDTPLHHANALDLTDKARRAAGSDLSKLLAGLGMFMTRGTTHISVADAAGGAVAMTLTNGEGNGEIVGNCGFMLNNMLGEEDVNPFGTGGWAAGKRLASMMAPTIALIDDGRRLVLGSGGSNRIRSAIAQVIAHAVLAGKPLAEAVGAPRLHVENTHLDIEAGFNAEDETALCAAFPDHRVWPQASMYFGGCHAIARGPNAQFTAVGDPRRAGVGLVV